MCRLAFHHKLVDSRPWLLEKATHLPGKACKAIQSISRGAVGGGGFSARHASSRTNVSRTIARRELVSLRRSLPALSRVIAASCYGTVKTRILHSRGSTNVTRTFYASLGDQERGTDGIPLLHRRRRCQCALLRSYLSRSPRSLAL